MLKLEMKQEGNISYKRKDLIWKIFSLNFKPQDTFTSFTNENFFFILILTFWWRGMLKFWQQVQTTPSLFVWSAYLVTLEDRKKEDSKALPRVFSFQKSFISCRPFPLTWQAFWALLVSLPGSIFGLNHQQRYQKKQV